MPSAVERLTKNRETSDEGRASRSGWLKDRDGRQVRRRCGPMQLLVGPFVAKPELAWQMFESWEFRDKGIRQGTNSVLTCLQVN